MTQPINTNLPKPWSWNPEGQTENDQGHLSLPQMFPEHPDQAPVMNHTTTEEEGVGHLSLPVMNFDEQQQQPATNQRQQKQRQQKQRQQHDQGHLSLPPPLFD